MRHDDIKNIQARIGVEPDGFWGPKSIAACQRHLREMMPSPSPWPKTDEASLTGFYGPAGEVPLAKVVPPFPIYLYDGLATVNSISIHEKLAPSLSRILAELHKLYPTESARSVAGINKYFGSYNNRPMRGGSKPSLHARAAAIDLDANRNGNAVHWPTKAAMPLEVMEVFAREGWIPAGAFWSRDAMHFQSTA